jgi:hypothetical protein
MKTIWKYETMELHGNVQFNIPDRSYFLSAQMQDGKIVFWFLVSDTTRPIFTRTFALVFTGEDVSSSKQYGYISENEYLATIQDGDGLVIHIFEVASGL